MNLELVPMFYGDDDSIGVRLLISQLFVYIYAPIKFSSRQSAVPHAVRISSPIRKRREGGNLSNLITERKKKGLYGHF